MKAISDLKRMLLARKADLEERLKPYEKLKEDLDEVNKALAALNPPSCPPYCDGCDICRRGPHYR